MATLPVSELKLATKVTSNSLKGQAGIIGIPIDDIKLSEFKLSEIKGVTTSGNTIAYNGTFVVTISTLGDQQYFNKIKTVASNYIATYVNTHLSLVSETNNTKTFRNIYNPNPTGSTSIASTLNVKFYDSSFNQDATNYNINFPINLTLYSPPSPTTTYSSVTTPPRPCCGVGVGWRRPCCNGAVTVVVNPGTWQGVAASNVTVYYSTNNVNFTAHSTVYAAQAVAIGGLTESTTYYIRCINNFGNVSNTIQATIPAYV